jgi:hypothetical protein
MAKFKQSNIELRDGQKLILDTSKVKYISYDGVEVFISTTLSGVTPTSSGHLTTKGYVDTEFQPAGDYLTVTTPQLGGDLDINSHNIDYGEILTSSGTYTGKIMTVTVDDSSTVFGNTLYCADDFHYERCDADSDTTMSCRCLAIESGAGSKKVLLLGQMCDTAWNWSVGDIYVGETAGELTQTTVSGSGDILQKVGFALSSTTLYFSPDSTVIEIT